MRKIVKYFVSAALCLVAVCGCKNGDLSGYIAIKTTDIGLDVNAIEDIDAQEPSDVSVIVDCENAWIAQVSDDWMTVSPNYGGGGKCVVTLTFLPNFKNDETDMAARSGELTIASHGTVLTIPIRQNGFIGEKKEVVSLGGIPDAAEFKAFADAATAGLSVERWTNTETKAVELLADIDISAYSPWSPICLATSTNAGAVKGDAYDGVFDGKGHTIKGLSITENNPAAGTGYGLFSVVQGGVIRNLTVEASNIAVVNPDCSSANNVHIGTIAGALVKGSISNCTAKSAGDGSVSVKIQSGASGLQTIGGICGCAYESKLEGCTSGATILCYNETNANNGGTGVSMGGLAGYCNGSCELTSCTNNGVVGAMVGDERWGSACRIGGFTGTTQGLVKITSCTNNGTITGTCICTSDKTSRTAGFVGYVNTADSQITGCVNNGNICFAPAGAYGGYVGGMVGQIANAFVIDGCETHGAILCDLYVDGHFYKRGDSSEVVGSGLFTENVDTDTFPEMGLVVGRPNSKATTVKNCKFSGKIGAYNDATAFTVITADNFQRFLYGCTYNRRKAVQTNEANTGNVYGE